MPIPNLVGTVLFAGVVPTLTEPSSQLDWLTSYGWLVGLVALGMLALAFTNYRYVLGYFALGMLYWLGVEGLQWLCVTLIPTLTDTQGYVFAIGLTLIPIIGVLAWLPSLATAKAHTLAEQSNDYQRLGAGRRPFILEKDTDFHQQYVSHTLITDK